MCLQTDINILNVPPMLNEKKMYDHRNDENARRFFIIYINTHRHERPDCTRIDFMSSKDETHCFVPYVETGSKRDGGDSSLNKKHIATR